MVGLGRTIPALPVGDIAAAVTHFRDRLGFTALHVSDGFAVVEREQARIHLWHAGDTTWTSREDVHERPIRSWRGIVPRRDRVLPVEADDVDGLYTEFARADVIHPASHQGVRETEFGTRPVPHRSTRMATSSRSSTGCERSRRSRPDRHRELDRSDAREGGQLLPARGEDRRRLGCASTRSSSRSSRSTPRTTSHRASGTRSCGSSARRRTSRSTSRRTRS